MLRKAIFSMPPASPSAPHQTDSTQDHPNQEDVPQTRAAKLRQWALWGSTKLPVWWLKATPGWIGATMGLSQEHMRRCVIANQRLIHGQRAPWIEARDVAETFANFGHCLAEGFAATTERARQFVFLTENIDVFDHAKSYPSGLVIVTAHMGSWDVAGGIMGKRGFRGAIAMAPENDAKARAVSDTAREKQGIRVFHVGRDPFDVLPIVRHVRGGGTIALQLDRVPPGMRSTNATLFRKKWPVPLGPFQIAQVTQTPILPVFTARLGFAKYLIHAGPWIPPPEPRNELSLHNAVRASVQSMERFITRFPTQWFHFVEHAK